MGRSLLVKKLFEKTKTDLKKLIAITSIPIILGTGCIGTGAVKKRPFIGINENKPAYVAKEVSHGLGAHKNDVTLYQMPIKALFFDVQKIDTTLNFEYTMRAFQYFWQSSSPVKEVNHRFDLNVCWEEGYRDFYLDYVKVSIYDHKSNGGGRGGLSRGFDRRGVQLGFSIDPFKNTKVKLEPNFFNIYRTSTRQRDLEDYMGFFELASSVEVKLDYIFRKFKFGTELNFGKQNWGTDLKKGNQMCYVEIGVKHIIPNFFTILGRGYAQNEMMFHNKCNKYVAAGLSWNTGM